MSIFRPFTAPTTESYSKLRVLHAVYPCQKPAVPVDHTMYDPNYLNNADQSANTIKQDCQRCQWNVETEEGRGRAAGGEGG